MKTILSKILAALWQNAPLTSEELPLIRDGSHAYYADLDYTNASVSNWQAINHLSRLRAAILSRGQAGLNEPAFRETALALWNAWLDHDYLNPNWWYNEIGTPHAAAEVAFLLKDHLTAEQWERACAIVSRGSLSHNGAILRWTGANLIWGVRGSIYYALMTDDAALLHRASDRAAEEVRIGEGLAEGIKPDMSFWQHGTQLYSCGYGRSFTSDTAQLIYLLDGTEFAFSEEKVRLFERFVLDGQRYMMRGSWVDPQTIGREIVRRGAHSSSSFRGALRRMLLTPSYSRKDELEAFYRELDGGECTFSGTKYFPCSCFLSHNTPAFHMAVKGTNTHFIGTEWGNFENLLGYNWAWGSTTAFLSDETDLSALAPVMDHACVPGTTVPHKSDEELHALTGGNWQGQRGLNDDCYGWDNPAGTRGILSLRVEHDGIGGLAAWFAYEDGMICLGCGFTSDKPLITTVQQALVPDDVPQGKVSLSCGGSVEAGGFVFVNLCELPMQTEVSRRTGSWKRNDEQTADLSETRSVMQITFEHPQGTASYAYAVLAKGADQAKIPVIVNTPERQSVSFPDGTSLSVTRENGKTVLG